MSVYKDQIGREVSIEGVPQRIISLVPSQTEFLYDIGLGNRVVGITKFCIHPEEWFRSKTRVGGTKEIHFDRINDLKPDLIICNKEENTKEIVETLEKDYTVWVTDISTLDESKEMMKSLGSLLDKEKETNHLLSEIEDSFKGLKVTSEFKKVLYFIWRKPWMVAGKGNIIDHILELGGWSNIVKQERYPEIILEEMEIPELIFLSSEPYPFKEQHIDELKSIFPHARIELVDGEMFSWYGSRLKLVPSYLADLQKRIQET